MTNATIPAVTPPALEAASSPVVLAWSGGKDSSLALDALRTTRPDAVACLLTTVTSGYDRVSIHGVRRGLLRRQAAAVGLPLVEAAIPPLCSNAQYEDAMRSALARLASEFPHATDVAFGDLFLEDVRRYREERLAPTGRRARFPLWGRDTRALAHDFVDRGFRAVLACVDTSQLPASFAGREFDERLLRDLPPGVDLCGENGEFHTFVYDGPGFRVPVSVERGEVVLRDERFAYCDLLPAAASE